MESHIGLQELEIGEHAIVESLQLSGGIRRRLLDIGLVENTKIECVGHAPSGDPIAIGIRGAVIAIRRSDCCGIRVRRV